MKRNLNLTRILAMLLSLALLSSVFALRATAQTQVDNFSYLTLDALSATYKNVKKSAQPNGVTLGHTNGIDLVADTEYTVSFKFRMEERTAVDKSNEYHDTDWALRAPILQAYRDGTANTQSNLELTGDNLNGSGFLYAHTVPLGEWKTYTASFKTEDSLGGNTWFCLIIYGGFRYSVGELSVTPAGGQTTVYSMDELTNLPTVGNMRDTSQVYSGTPSEENHIFPALNVELCNQSTVLTLDTLDADYVAPTGGARVNGIKLGEKQGINLSANTAYTVSLDFRLDEILRPTAGVSSSVYDCRSPIIQVYKDGVNPINALSASSNTTLDSSWYTGDGRVNPWKLIDGGYAGKWITFNFSFTTTEAPQNAVWFALVNFGAMKVSYKNLTVTDFKGVKTFYSLGRLFEVETVQDDVYFNGKQSGKYPEVTVFAKNISLAGDANGNGTVDIIDLVRIKKYLADVSGTKINTSAADSDLICGVNSNDMVTLRKKLLGSLQYAPSVPQALLKLENETAVQQNFLGFNAISHGFQYMPDIFNRNYTPEQIEVELARIEKTGVKMLRTYYDQGFAAEYDNKGNLIKNPDGSICWNWETAYMNGFYQWLEAMQERNIDVILNLSWGTHIVSTQNTIFGQKNPFAGMGVSEVTAAYADWAAESVKQIIEVRGFTNVKYVLPFTEPYVAISLTGSKISDATDSSAEAEKTSQTEWYTQAVAALDTKLKALGLRDDIKIIGPNVALRDDVANAPDNPTLEQRIDWWVEKLNSYVDIYSFHWYAPAYPEYSNPTNDLFASDTYDLQTEYLSRITPILNQTGKELWFDELNYFVSVNGGNLHDNVQQGYSGTQLAQLVIANMNAGVQNSLLWSLNDAQFPMRGDTKGEYVDGVHMTGVMPNLNTSDVPYKQYYAYTLFSKYLTDSTPMSVFGAENGTNLYATMVEKQDGSIAIAVVNSSNTEVSFDLKTNNLLSSEGVTLNRHLYNPEGITPNANADIIKCDKTFKNVTHRISDTIPAGGVVVYTTEK